MFSNDKSVSAFYSRPSDDASKSSYYVWFLGSKESKGLRGAEYIRPVVRSLLERKNDVKLTLQVSGKGMKIVQTPEKNKNNKKVIPTVPVSGLIGEKQFIPHSSITSVMQSDAPNDDVVSCILLVSNSTSDCPLYVHSYRCDSPETAVHLKQQLQILVDKPENKSKFDEIENRLIEKGLLLPKEPNSKNSAANPLTKWALTAEVSDAVQTQVVHPN